MRENNGTKEGINRIRNLFFKNSLIKYKTSKETDLQMRERKRERKEKVQMNKITKEKGKV